MGQLIKCKHGTVDNSVCLSCNHQMLNCMLTGTEFLVLQMFSVATSSVLNVVNVLCVKQ